jgi:hypothetical protein
VRFCNNLAFFTEHHNPQVVSHTWRWNNILHQFSFKLVSAAEDHLSNFEMFYSAAVLFFATWSLSLNSLCICSISNSIPSPSTISSGVNVFSEMENELFLTKLSKKVSLVANIPIFEFGQDLTEFLSGNVDPSTLLDLELIFYDYMSKLRSYYFLIYSNFEQVTLSDGLHPIRLNLMQERDYCVDQCRKAMKSALPVSSATISWSFQV